MNDNRGKWISIGYWASTCLTALLFAAPGFALLLRDPHFVADMARLGYPSYFLPFLGIWKIWVQSSSSCQVPDVSRNGLTPA